MDETRKAFQESRYPGSCGAEGGSGISPVEIPAGSLEGQLEWAEVFGDGRPVELEVGFGKGTFLREAARLFPDRNFLGIEWSAKYVRLVRQRLVRLGLANVRIVRAEARHFFEHFLADGSLAAIHIYHPDPWPKRRHHKRRLMRREFIVLALAKLAPGGRIVTTTDFEAYFAFMREEAGAVRDRDERIEVEEAEGPGAVMTNYSRKHLERGGRIFRLEIRKPG